MGDDLERVLRGLEAAKEFARTYRFEMTDEYRALIEQVEAMARNQSRADKSGHWIGCYADANTWLTAVTPVPRK